MFSLIKAITLSQEELDMYYMIQRKNEFYRTGGIPRFVKVHNLLHTMLVPLIRLQRKFSGIELTICADERKKTNSPKVYACTHIGGVDIESAFEAIVDPCWLLLGDPREVYKNIDGILLGLNGVICLETRNKDDRHIAKESAVQLLQHGGNLLIFPEGAWNLSVNLPVTGLFTGAVEMALRSQAEIIPVALECYGKHMYVAIGENMDMSAFGMVDKKKITADLRNQLATLKWQIWEYVGIQKRRELRFKSRKEFVDSIINGNKEMSYCEQDVLDTMYVDKNIVSYQEVFSFFEDIQIDLNNAFLAKGKRMYVEICSKS